MSENRQKYSSSPLYGLNRNHSNGGGFRVPPERRQNSRRNQHTFVWLQVLMSLLLPILFVVAMVCRRTEIHWAFLALSALSLLIMWAFHAFVPQARTTMTLLYIALMIVSLAAALWFTTPISSTSGSGTGTGSVDYGALFGSNVTASDVSSLAANSGYSEQSGDAAPVVTPTPTQNSQSEAQEKLELFMDSWMSSDYTAMISCCTPSWVSNQENPERAMFNIRGVNTPVSYNITYVAGSQSDDSRTITMEAVMDRANGTQKNYRYEVLMLRVNGVWYVDPASLSSATEIKDSVTPTVEITLMPTFTPNPNKTLYYNPDGGSYYHADEWCSQVNSKYLPLKGSFTYSQVNDSAYKDLEPCSSCSAPGRS